MEISTVFIGIAAGAFLGALLTYLFLKSSHVARQDYDTEKQNFLLSNSNLEKAQEKIAELNTLTETLQNSITQNAEETTFVKDQNATLTAQNNILSDNNSELKTTIEKHLRKIEQLNDENKLLFSQKASLKSENNNLTESLATQKADLEKLQKEATLQFENLANKIFEEKSKKFTEINSDKLKVILDPFNEKIAELKKQVNDAYDKESKERFSLADKVKELAVLNQQISDDAKKLTRALKGESKTQGNWGEMILESILEKSGLVKGREYFLEHELRDEDNKALFSEFSGKKMRPDAVIKYPDARNVIIDSKVSLTAFVDLVEETDPEILQIKTKQHLDSIKNHIKQLSDKAYDDYDKSLDFVMMFIPSEAAYIAAMQSDPNLWNFAYDKRILLLNPSNLITSLKLVADLWKREYQNKNAAEIAERGAKLYDKFVGFLENLEKVGKNIDQAKTVYEAAFKQLHTGNDNLITQTQKLQNLGIKNKKHLPQSLLDISETVNLPKND